MAHLVLLKDLTYMFAECDERKDPYAHSGSARAGLDGAKTPSETCLAPGPTKDFQMIVKASESKTTDC